MMDLLKTDSVKIGETLEELRVKSKEKLLYCIVLLCLFKITLRPANIGQCNAN